MCAFKFHVACKSRLNTQQLSMPLLIAAERSEILTTIPRVKQAILSYGLIGSRAVIMLTYQTHQCQGTGRA